MYNGLLKQYASFLPVSEKTPNVSLMEGNTPLIPLPNLSKKLGITLYGKYEGANPTGSFKDRGMVMAVAKAKEAGSEAIICASTGNTSASAAAYAARLGMKCIIVIPEGKIAHGKLAQAIAYGAEIISIEGNFDDALRAVRQIAAEEPITLVNSVNPYRIEGQKTAAFEICDQLQKAPDVLAIPVGNAGNITAYWKGFCEYEKEKGYKKPRIHGFEAEGAAAIVKGHVIDSPETVATAIRIGNPASWSYAVEAAEQSQGEIDMVTDEEILQAYGLLAKNEGVFVEPGSSASLAGVIKHVRAGKINENETVVLVLTGNGLKDPDIALSSNKLDIANISNDMSKIKEHIKEVIVS
ncbi:threonine synthase [Bacillus sp. DX1.1]|uniref:threonine synthase n=1 Tax=unclassified Bacillus (in: firmicutes) TaxID=185979 RepID=UPI00256FD3DD|nr:MULTISPECIES: threonine synthase [unclassified Bacillus (in: firmicutes)]MDM5154515.1 threonine synthase [Bacillus sp. DX1.1]WJE83412.1 threonine synthase [Bacillus sp. DX3.1]